MPESKVSAVFTIIYNFTIFTGTSGATRRAPDLLHVINIHQKIVNIHRRGESLSGLITVFFLDRLCDRLNKKVVWEACLF